MAKCAYCGSETELHVNNIPVCLECDENGNFPDKRADDGEPRMPPGKVQITDRKESAAC